ncbi:MAG: thioredoxin family protein [Brevundimonas sp.]|uniref:protein-disulfide reductase DsbD family protein n=1 Tax=Brevundimonas sp. TaxID=1871086 RepID=UPI0030031E30
MASLLAVLIGGWLAMAAAPVPAQDASPTVGPASTDRITAELVSMTASATPGSTLILAVRQDIKPDWHTYWRNPGDSGGATTLNWSLPQGWEAGDIVWPLPERQPLSGLMNYGYSDVVYLPVPIAVPADAEPGRMLDLSVTALFLVCSAEMCVPDELTLGLRLPVGAGDQTALETRHASAIQAVLQSSPRPAGLTARVARADDGRLTLAVTGDAVQGPDGPGPVYFFPFEGGIIDHAAPQTGTWGPEGLSLTLAPGGKVRAGGLTGPVGGVITTGQGAYEIIAEPGPLPEGVSGGGTLRAEDAAGPTGFDPSALLQAALLALIGGLILNLMPCVFPILAMKAAALARAAHDPQAARRDGLMFLAGVLVTFLLLAGLMLGLRAAGEAVGWGFQLQSPVVVLSLALLTLSVGLNLSGVYHIGQSLQGLGEARLSRLPGGTGAFFTGVLAVAVAAPCTAPFMAAALGAALVMPWAAALIVFLMLGLGLALPFVVVAFSPALLTRLPRPGPWMERMKGLLAFPMYATTLWLAWVAARQAGSEVLALGLIAGLMLALALWLWGTRQAGAGRWTLVLGALSLIAVIAALVLVSRMEPVTRAQATASAAAGPEAGVWSADAVAAAQAGGRPVLVNFTADWCVTCKINERVALTSGQVRAAMDETKAVYLVGDWTVRDPAITRELERHGRSGVPLYLLYAPGTDTPRVLPQLLTPGLVAEAIRTAGS